MTKDKARSFIGRYRPCEHENADTRLGNGKIWARCEDCGATFQQEDWQDARDAAAEFDIALDVLNKGEDSQTAIQLKAYAAEIKVDNLTVVELINSHRRLVQELNTTTRPEYRKTLEKARKWAVRQQLDQDWIRISKLRRMSLAKIAQLIGD